MQPSSATPPDSPFTEPLDELPDDGGRQRRINKRLLVGCGCGCLLPIFALATLFVMAQVWIASPGEQIDPRRVLLATSDGYVQAAPPMASDELADLMYAVVETAHQRFDVSDFDREAAPDVVAFLENTEGLDRASIDGSFAFLPDHLTGALRKNGQGGHDLVIALRLAAGGSVAGTLFDWFGTELSEDDELYGEHRLVPFQLGPPADPDAPQTDTRTWLTMYLDTPLIATGRKALVETLDHLDATQADIDAGAAPGPQGTALLADWERMQTTAFLSIVMGHAGPLEAVTVRNWFDLLGAGQDQAAWPEVDCERLRFELRLEDGDALARIDVIGLPPAEVVACQAFADAWIAEQQAYFAAEDLELAGEALAGTDSLVLDLRLQGLREHLVEQIMLQLEAAKDR